MIKTWIAYDQDMDWLMIKKSHTVQHLGTCETTLERVCIFFVRTTLESK